MKKTNTISIGGIKIVIGNESCCEIGKELKLQNREKALIVTDRGIVRVGLLDPILQSMEETGVGYCLFDEVLSDPGASIVRKGTEVFLSQGCDAVLAVGGGSVMDCAKAVNMMTKNEGDILDYATGKTFINDGYPLFSVPTTSGTGSEVTQYAVITDEKKHRKECVGDPRLTSDVVFLSPLMTVGLPPKITAATGIDALTHGIEAYTTNRVLNAAGSTLISDTLALKGIEIIASNLAKAYWNGANLEVRKNMMMGCTLTGLVTQAGSGSAHGIGAALGACYHVPHGVSVGVVLPYVMEASIEACPERFRDIAIAMGKQVEGMSLSEAAKEAVVAVSELLKALRFPVLKDYIQTQEELFGFVAEAMEDHCNDLNAHVLTEEEMKNVLLDAWENKKYGRH